MSITILKPLTPNQMKAITATIMARMHQALSKRPHVDHVKQNPRKLLLDNSGRGENPNVT